MTDEGNPFRMVSQISLNTSSVVDERNKAFSEPTGKKKHIYEKGVRHRKTLRELLDEDPEDRALNEYLEKKQTEKLLSQTQTKLSHRFGKDTLQEMIAKKREMFFVQYSLGVKRGEIQKLEDAAQNEEKKLMEDEKNLEEDAAKFDAFLKENDRNSVEAIKKAEVESKVKLEKVQEIKRLNAKIMSVKSELSKNDEQLKNLQHYRTFLEQLTPPSWKAERSLEWSMKSTGNDPKQKPESDSHSPKLAGKGPDALAIKSSKDELLDFEDKDEQEFEIYFQNAEQLLDIYAELEENNLALIQNCQETEESLEELKHEIRVTESNMEKETQSLTTQIKSLTESIKREEEKARIIQDRSRNATHLFGAQVGLNGGKVDQDSLLDELNKKVKEVYRKVIGESDGSLTTLQLLTSIENKLESFFEVIEQMPPGQVEAAEKLKDKERRQRLREEKMEQQKKLQEERVQRALQRANAPILKKSGKPLMFRSALAPKKKKATEEVNKSDDADQEWYWG